MPDSYPNSVPKIDIQKKKNISSSQCNQIQQEMEEYSTKCLGREMLFDLIENAIEQLSKFGRKVSFYDEMLQRKETLIPEKTDMTFEDTFSDKVKERLHLMETIKEEQQQHKSYTTKNYLVGDGGRRKKLILENAIDLNGQNIKELELEPLGVDYFLGFLFKTNFEITVNFLPITTAFYRGVQGRKKLTNLAKDIKLLPPPHPLLIRYLQVQIESDGLWILSDDYQGITIAKLIEQCGSIHPSKAIEYISQVAQCLAHLHENKIVHRDICPGNIILQSGMARLRFPVISRCLKELDQIHSFTSALTSSDGHDLLDEGGFRHLPPEVLSSKATIGHATDIWQLGILFCTLILGKLEEDLERDLIKLPESCRSIAAAMLHPNPQKRSSAVDIFNNKIPTIIPLPPSLPLSNEKKMIGNDDIGIMKTPSMTIGSGSVNIAIPSPTSSLSSSLLSRYRTDFDEIQFLGKGGFGEVVKVRNKIDGRLYAVKKIKLATKGDNKKILREVATLSRLHHDRIVRYYQAWIEGVASGEWNGSGGSSSSSTTKESDTDFDDEEEEEDWMNSSLFGSLSTGRKSSGSIMGAKAPSLNKLFQPPQPFSALQEKELLASTINTESSLISNDEEDDTPKRTKRNQSGPNWIHDSALMINVQVKQQSRSHSQQQPHPQQQQCLYIQMDYCPNQTLKNILDDPEPLQPNEIWRLFRQIVEGLTYIHSQGLIHRDLKPGNIFLDSNGDVKIGDFGLAISKQDHEPMESIAGTPIYVAPETLDINQKADMYSLGIIFVEMWIKFSTLMERATVLSSFKKESKLPEGFRGDEKSISILKHLLVRDPEKRMSSEELLMSEWMPPKLEDEAMTELIRSITAPGTVYFGKLLSTLFQYSPKDSKHKDWIFDLDLNLMSMYENVDYTRQGMIKIFTKHSAIELNTPLLFPKQDPSGVPLLNQVGMTLQLPFDLTRPFARMISKNTNLINIYDDRLHPHSHDHMKDDNSGSSNGSNNRGLVTIAADCTYKRIIELKRYTFGNVYRENITGGQPIQILESDFDIITSEPTILEEIEAIKVASEVAFMVNLQTPWIKINHYSIVDALCRNQDLRTIGLEKTSTWPGLTWSKAKHELGCSSANEPILVKFFNVRVMDAEQGLIKTESLLRSMGGAGAALQGCIHLRRVLQALNLLNLGGSPLGIRIIMDPLLCYNSSTFNSGIIFQLGGSIMASSKSKKQQQRHHHHHYRQVDEVFAAGGRYDGLLEFYRHPKGIKRFGIGINFGVMRLSKAHRSSLPTHTETDGDSVSSNIMTRQQGSSNSLFPKYHPFSSFKKIFIIGDVSLSNNVLQLANQCWDFGFQVEYGITSEYSSTDHHHHSLHDNNMDISNETYDHINNEISALIILKGKGGGESVKITRFDSSSTTKKLIEYDDLESADIIRVLRSLAQHTSSNPNTNSVMGVDDSGPIATTPTSSISNPNPNAMTMIPSGSPCTVTVFNALPIKQQPAHRTIIMDKTIKAITPMIQSLRSISEVIAVDLPRHLLRSVTDNLMDTEEVWRRVSISNNDRDVANRLRSLLKTVKEKGERVVLVYGYKDGWIEIVPLIKGS